MSEQQLIVFLQKNYIKRENSAKLWQFAHCPMDMNSGQKLRNDKAKYISRKWHS